MTRSCACGEKETYPLPVTDDHHLDASGVCTVCGHTHAFGGWVVVSAANCGTSGIDKRVCECGEYELQIVPATGEHQFDAEGQCAICSHSHSYGAWQELVSPTCGSDGILISTCSCGAVRRKSISASTAHIFNDSGVCVLCGHLHSWKEWVEIGASASSGKSAAIRYCDCGALEAKSLIAGCSHTFNDVGVCTACGHKHAFGQWHHIVAATCGRHGTQAAACECGAVTTQTLSATEEHQFIDVGSEYMVCQACGARHYHQFGEYVTVEEPSCSKAGKQLALCACGQRSEKEIPKNDEHNWANGAACADCGALCPDGYVFTDDEGNRWQKDEWGNLRRYDDLPDALDYGNEVITVLGWSDVEKPEFQKAAGADDARSLAIAQRNAAVERRLGVTLNFVTVPGNSSSINSFVAHVKTAFDSGLAKFDLIATYSRTHGALLASGMLTDIAAIENSYLDFEKPWWPADLQKELGIGDSLYGVTGDISATAIDEMHCVYFNQNLLNELYADEASAYFANQAHTLTTDNTATSWLYELALKGQWTLDDLLCLSGGVYKAWSENISGELSIRDRFGLCGASYTLSSLYGAAGLRQIAADDSRVLKVSEDYTSLKTETLISKLGALMNSNDCFMPGKDGQGSPYIRPFHSGNALFAVQYMELGEDYLVGNEAMPRYGVLPLPKYDAAQERYYTTLGNAYTVYSIFSGFDARGSAGATSTMLSAVLECWASEAYRRTTPVILEANMQLSGRATQAEAELCEIIRSSMSFDLGNTLSHVINGDSSLDSMMISAALKGEEWDPSEQIKDIEEALQTLLDGLKS
ncbi:MAG: hypothetical protein E7644_08360 [Ruminococcaceae bacterium]|nr:hypothetical protein [Oscillospiraceae bacterium]